MVAVTSRMPSTEPLLKTMIHDNASIFRMRFWPIEKMDPPAAKRLGEIDSANFNCSWRKRYKVRE